MSETWFAQNGMCVVCTMWCARGSHDVVCTWFSHNACLVNHQPVADDQLLSGLLEAGGPQRHRLSGSTPQRGVPKIPWIRGSRAAVGLERGTNGSSIRG